MSFDANPTRRRRRAVAVSRIRKLRVSIIRRANLRSPRIGLFWVYASGRPNTRRKWKHERTGINDVRRVCPQRNANSNANATAAWRDSLDLRTCQTRSSDPRVLSIDTRARRYTINEIATRDTRNLIGYWYFYLYDVECATQESGPRWKMLDIIDTWHWYQYSPWRSRATTFSQQHIKFDANNWYLS